MIIIRVKLGLFEFSEFFEREICLYRINIAFCSMFFFFFLQIGSVRLEKLMLLERGGTLLFVS